MAKTSLLEKRINIKTLRLLSVLALLVLLLPMLVLGTCAAPQADDWGYAATAHHAFEESGSVLKTVYTAGTKAVEHWFGWQGTFSAIFFMALQPAVFSEDLYFLTTVIMLTALIVGSLIFCRGLLGRVFGLEKALCDVAAVCVSICATQLVPSAVQAFFWFNGSVYYVVFYGFMLTALALGTTLVQKGGLWRSALLCLLGFLIGGGNYVTALISCVLWVFSLALLIYRKDKSWKKLIPPGLFLLAAFALSVLAPGNAYRIAVSEGYPPLEAILRSFQCGLSYGFDWLTLPVLSTLVFLALLIWPALDKSEYSFRFPALVSAFSYCIISAMFCPPIFAMGNAGDLRTVNIIYFAWLMVMLINLCYWLGWLKKRRKVTETPKSGYKLTTLALCAVLLLGSWGIAAARGESYTSVQSLSALRSGEAQAYRDCFKLRYEVLNDESQKEAYIKILPCEPELLYFSDISVNVKAWQNIVLAEFYGKDTVSLTY